MINFDAHVSAYKFCIDSMLEPASGTSKPVKLVFVDTIVNITNAQVDSVRGDGNIRDPVWKTESDETAPVVTENSRIIYALVEVDPQPYDNFGTIVENPQLIIRLKTKIAEGADLQRCKHLEFPIADFGILTHRYKLDRAPVPVGLRNNIYLASFWRAI